MAEVEQNYMQTVIVTLHDDAGLDDKCSRSHNECFQNPSVRT